MSHRKKQKPAETPKVDRRGFLKAAAATSLTIFIPSDAHYSEEWAFIGRNVNLNRFENEAQLRSGCVPLGTEHLMPGGFEAEILKRQWEPEIIAQMKQKGMDPSTKVSLFHQYFGLPDEKRFSEPLMNYCRKALDYTHYRIKGTEKTHLDLVVLKNGDDFEKKSYGKEFIGAGYYSLARAVIESPIADKILPSLRYSPGGMYYFDTQSDKVSWYISFISTGQTALTSPFAETIPIGTAEILHKDAKVFGDLQALQVNEAMHESIAYFLALEFAREQGVPNFRDYIEKTSSMLLKERYLYVPNAKRWVMKNGVQQAYDLYMEDPRKFLEAIKRA